MHQPYLHLDFDEHDGVFCVRLKKTLHGEALEELGVELNCLVNDRGCRKMVLNLGPEDVECLYSILLAKLVNLQRRLEAAGGALALAQLSENTQGVFRATALDRHFRFYRDQASAVKALTTPAP